jgi:hypothetical protein
MEPIVYQLEKVASIRLAADVSWLSRHAIISYTKVHDPAWSEIDHRIQLGEARSSEQVN